MRGRVLVRVYSCLSSMQRACAVLSAAALAPPLVSTLSQKRHDFRVKITGKKMCVFSVQLLFEIFLIQTRIQRDIAMNVKTSLCKVPVILVRF